MIKRHGANNVGCKDCLIARENLVRGLTRPTQQQECMGCHAVSGLTYPFPEYDPQPSKDSNSYLIFGDGDVREIAQRLNTTKH